MCIYERIFCCKEDYNWLWPTVICGDVLSFTCSDNNWQFYSLLYCRMANIDSELVVLFSQLIEVKDTKPVL